MAIEDKVINELSMLSKQEKVKFCSSCVHRVIQLYKKFDAEEDISQSIPKASKGEGYSFLSSILDFIDDKLMISSKKEIIEQIKKCDPLIVDFNIYGNSVNVYVAQLIAQTISFILEFYIEDDNKKINYCVDNILEILNQKKSDEYYNVNPKGSNTELRLYLNDIFTKELEIEESLISAIKENDDRKLKYIISNNLIN